MAKYNDKTARGWPLPHRENRLYDDVERLREALNLIDEAISGVETHEGVIEDKQDSLETRLDTILEGATEESEILDARVDAQDNVHPNLGHNVRNLHRLILGLGDDILYEGSEFEGLLRQYSDLVHAQLQGELNSLDAHKRRKFEISQEALSRFQDDSGIQSQVDLLAGNDIKNALARKIERETSRAEHEERIKTEEFLQAEIDSANYLSQQEYEARTSNEGFLQNELDTLSEGQNLLALSVQSETESRRKNDSAEISQRTEYDEALQSEIDTLSRAQISQALNAKSEAESRRKNDSEIREALTAEIQQEKELSIVRDLFLQDDISAERRNRKQYDNAEFLQRVEYDEVLQAQINQLANSILQSAITFRNSIERRKLEIKQEILTRSQNDDDLRSSLNESLSQCGMLQSQVDSLISEVFQVNSNLLSLAESFQQQIDSNAQAGLENTLAIQYEAEQRRKLLARLIQERQDRELQIHALRAEISQLYEIPLPGLHDDLARLHNEAEKNAHANLRNAVTIVREIQSRREALNQEALTRNAALNQEALTRNEQVAGILQQTNLLAHAVLRLALQQHQTSKRVSEIEIEESSTPGQVAKDSEFDEMLDELYQNP